MGPDKLDKFIKGQVENHKTPTDPDALWKAIQAKQGAEEKPKRRFLFFWLFGGAVVLLAGLGILFYTLNTTDDTNTNTGSLLTEEMKNENENENENKSEIKSDTLISTSNKNANNLKSENTVTSSQSTINSNGNFNGNDNTEASMLNSTKNTNTYNSAVTQQGQTNSKSSDTDSSYSPTVTTKNNKTSKAGLNQSDTDKLTTPVLADSTNQSSTPTETEQVSTTTLEDQTKTAITSIVKIKLLELDVLIISLEAPSSTLAFVEQQKKNKPAPDYVDKDRSLDEKNNWLLSTGLGFTYGKAASRLTSDNEDYLQERKDSETPLDAVRLSFDMRIQSKKGFYIKPGFEYEQINERYDNQFSRDTLLYRPDIVIAEVYDINGQKTDSIGEAQVVERKTITKEIYNRYRSIDIPLLVGYAHSKNKLGWFVEGGASLNLWFKNTGEIFLDETDSGRMEDNSNLFKKRTGVSLMANAGLSYQLSEQFSTWLSPGIKYHLGSISSDENLIEQKQINYGLQVGIRYHW